MNKILFYQNIIPHYRVPIFEKLDKAINNKLIVVYGRGTREHLHTKEIEFPFPNYNIGNYWLNNGRLLFQSFWKPFIRYGDPSVLITPQNLKCLSFYPLILYANLKKIPIIHYGHGGSRKRSIVKSIHPYDILHRYFMRRCDAFICYTDQTKLMLSDIMSPSKIFVANNTLDTDLLFSLRKQMDKKGKKVIREIISLDKSQYYIAFIGRFAKTKQVDKMLKVLKILQDLGLSIGGVIIGDGEERKNLEKLSDELNLKDIHFTGFISDWERSSLFLYACDVLLNPGYVGLSVNHALSMGLPVITQYPSKQGPIHSPEVDFIIEDLTGYFAKNGCLKDLASKTILSLNNNARLKKQCISFAERYLNINKMIEGYLDAIKFVLKTK